MYLRMCVCMYRGVIFYACVAVHGLHEFKSIRKSSYNLAHRNKLRFMRGTEYVPRTRKYSNALRFSAEFMQIKLNAQHTETARIMQRV
jgi:hypothetical protein